MVLRDSAFCASSLGVFIESANRARGCPAGCFYIGTNYVESISRSDGSAIWNESLSSIGGAERPIRINDNYVFSISAGGGTGNEQASLMSRDDGSVLWTATIGVVAPALADLFIRGEYAYFHFRTSLHNPRVRQYKLDGGALQWDWTSSNVIRSTSSSAIYVDSNGTTHVGYRDNTTNNLAIEKVDVNGNHITTIAGDSTQSVRKMNMDPAETFYIIGGTGGTLANLSAVDLTGTIIWNPFTTAAIGDVVYRNGWIYAAENGASASIYRVDPSDGSHDLTLTPGGGSIYGVDSDEEGNIYMVQASSFDDVRKYDSAGNLLWEQSQSGNVHGLRVRAD